MAGSVYGSVDPRGGSQTDLICVPRSPPSVVIRVWIPEVALVQILVCVPRSPSPVNIGWVLGQ